MIDGNTKQAIKISRYDVNSIITMLIHYRSICNVVDSSFLNQTEINSIIDELYKIKERMYKDETIDITRSHESFH